jgi:peptidoglycan/xylan/chitin deacetylase (PgdA/CDA1 family)
MKKVVALMYHDVVERDAPDAAAASGFAGADADLYKLTREDFKAHLDRIASVSNCSPALAHELVNEEKSKVENASNVNESASRAKLIYWLLTFDDGGASAHSVIAEMLEARDWRGHFFITTDRINTRGFLTRAQILDLYKRGHIIGSHSVTHPPRISECSTDELRYEWRTSVETLSEIVGERISAASVPNGFYSRAVAEAAAQAGIKVLFTSEPTVRCKGIGDCLIVGRFAMQRQTAPEFAASLVANKRAPQIKQAMIWKAKKIAKIIGGEFYLKARRSLLNAGARDASNATDAER